MANMDAVLVLAKKETHQGIYIQETVVWRVPTPVPGSIHLFKYRLFFGKPGERIIGFDNERGKGDHRHIDGKEGPYVFVDVATLLTEFEQEVVEWLTSKGAH